MGRALVTKGGLSALALAKVESSGLTAAQAAKLGMRSVENAVTLEPYFNGQPALVIPYYDINGNIAKAHPKWPDFYRARYLGEDHSFAAATDKKASKYIQPKGTGVCAYFPPLVDWKAIAAKPEEDILITEGELKAAKATAEGFPTIGLGGIYNFRSAKQGIFFLPELEDFVWPQRKVTIVYDSDYQSNPNVCAAINALAEELSERGALCYVGLLESVYDDETKKTGLDDFLVERGDDALLKVLEASEALGIARKLWAMNDEVVYVENPGFVVCQETMQKLPIANFTGHSKWATENTPERKVTPKGEISYEKIGAAQAWIRWPLRQAVHKLTYKPGAEQFHEEKGQVHFNQWAGWGVQAKKGDIKPWNELLKFIFQGAEPEALEWFLDWCAFPLQNPGSKLFSACLIWGRMTGTGKTLIFYTLKQIYGENFIKIKNEDLLNTWWLENKQFVLGDEISGNDKRSESDALKSMITQEEVNINVKFIPQFSIPDCANYGFTSNHPDALFMDDEDRRFFVHEVMAEEPLPEAFYKKYDAWKSGEGAAALFHHLLQRDLSKFNPKGPAFRTAARSRMVMNSKSDLASWCRELRERPDSILRLGQMRYARDLFTSREMLAIYQQDNDEGRKVTTNGMSRALASAGFKQAYAGMPITAGQAQGRYFIIRNHAKWYKVTKITELARHIDQAPVR